MKVDVSLSSLLKVFGWLLDLFRAKKKGPQEVSDEAETEVDDMSHDERIDVIRDGMRDDD